jgi:hypothetical protein
VVTPVLRGTDVDGGTGSVTASYTPKPQHLYLLSISSNTNLTADPNAPTATGNGMTWTQVATVVWDTTGPTRKRITLLAAMGSAPTAGTISIDFGGQAQTIANHMLDEQPLAALTSNANTMSREVTTTSQSDITLSEFARPYNLSYGVFTVNTGSIATALGLNGQRIVQDNAGVTDLQMVSVEGVNTKIVGVDWGSGFGANIMGGIAVELASVPVGLLDAYPLEVLDGPRNPRSEMLDAKAWF